MFTVSFIGIVTGISRIQLARAKFLLQAETGNTNYRLVYHPSSAGELKAILQVGSGTGQPPPSGWHGPCNRPDNSNCTDGMEKVSD